MQRVVREIPNLDEELATQVARHLSGLIEVIKTSRAIIEQYRNRTSPFDPNAFSVMKLYRTLGVAALRGRLDEILESGHLQALAESAADRSAQQTSRKERRSFGPERGNREGCGKAP